MIGGVLYPKSGLPGKPFMFGGQPLFNLRITRCYQVSRRPQKALACELKQWFNSTDFLSTGAPAYKAPLGVHLALHGAFNQSLGI